jgi:conjugal transfer pilus assembly protein TraE
MHIGRYVKDLYSTRAIAFFLLLANIGLVLALMANGLYRRVEILHVVPASVSQEYLVTSDGNVSDEYRRQIALTLLPFVTNVTPRSVEFGHTVLLRYVAPEQYGMMSEGLGAERIYIVGNNLNRVFFPDATEIVGDDVIISGLERRFSGSILVAEEEREYHLTLRFKDFKPEIVAISSQHRDRARAGKSAVQSGRSETDRRG